ncbi:MAG: YgaP family membrane protein [Planctomycetota bacterium]|jgi:hypothetical protein
MKLNVGNIDRAVRILAAAVLAFLYFQGTVTGTLGIVLLIAAAVFALTGFVGMRPLYRVFGISTCKVRG